MDEMRKDLLTRMIKIIVLIAVMFAIFMVLSTDISKSVPEFFANLFSGS